jgi:hypothetical protein
MALKTMAVTRQWLSSDYMVAATDIKATIAVKQSNGVFCAVRAEML